MDTLTRINWTLAKILLAALLSAVLLGGIATVGMVGYGFYVATKTPEERHISDEEAAQMSREFNVIWESPSQRVNR